MGEKKRAVLVGKTCPTEEKVNHVLVLASKLPPTLCSEQGCGTESCLLTSSRFILRVVSSGLVR